MNRAAQVTPSVIEAAPVPPPPGEQSIDDSVETTVEQIKNRLARLAAVDAELAEVIRNVHVQITPDGILIDAVDEDKGLLFDVSSAKLNEPLERFLRALAPRSRRRRTHRSRSTVTPTHVRSRRAPTCRTGICRISAPRRPARSSRPQACQPVRSTACSRAARRSCTCQDNPLAAQNRRLSILVKIANSTGPKAAIDGKPLDLDAAKAAADAATAANPDAAAPAPSAK